jgi:uncharacterized protein YifN (PemK superfamily)
MSQKTPCMIFYTVNVVLHNNNNTVNVVPLLNTTHTTQSQYNHAMASLRIITPSSIIHNFADKWTMTSKPF